jgi:hypothetical protein
MSRNNSGRSVTITDSNAKPKSEKEVMDTVQMTANALLGTYGDGEWNGGIGGAQGFYCRYAKFWDAKLVYEIHGSTEILFPFTLVEAIVRITNASSGATSINYVERSLTLPVSGDGKYILEVFFVKNIKEAQS